jgi:glycerophosphoryl diester phosphodiesterase
VPGVRVPEVQGHRGARALRPENTLPGLAYALAIGVDAIEFDVTLTADGGLILAHDLTVSAKVITDGGPAVPGDPLFPYLGRRWLDLTLPQVATLDAGSREFPAPYLALPGTGVPTLSQVCELITDAGAVEVTLAVELKTDPSWPDPDVRKLTASALGTLAAHGVLPRSRLLAFDWRVLRTAAAIDPSVSLVALVETRTWLPGSAWLAGLDPADYGPGLDGGDRAFADCVTAARDIGAAWVSPWAGATSPELIDAAHRNGLRVSVWTVNDPARMTELTGQGADALVTDRPDILRRVLADQGRPLPSPVVFPGALAAPGVPGVKNAATIRAASSAPGRSS